MTDYTINPCRLCVLQNTLGGKPLISRSANTCVFLLFVPLMLQAFQHNSGLSPLQRITLCQCVWHHTWLVVLGVNYLMVIAVVNHYQFRVQVFLTTLPIPQPHMMLYHVFLHHIDVKLLILWRFSTQKLQMWKFSDNCGFRYTFHKFFQSTHNLLRALIDLSLYSQAFESFLLAWGRYLWFHSSDLYLDWTLPKQPGYVNFQGNIEQPTAEAYGTISIWSILCYLLEH